MLRAVALLLATVVSTAGAIDVDANHADAHHHHHHHHRHHHHKHAEVADAPAAKVLPAHAVKALPAVSVTKSKVTDKDILAKMKQLETEMDAPLIQAPHGTGNIKVNGPLEKGFDATFAKAVAAATGCKADEVTVTKKTEDKENAGVVELEFKAPMKAVSMVEHQAADPESKLAKGELRPFLVEKDDDEEPKEEKKEKKEDEDKEEKKEDDDKDEKKDKKEKKEKKEDKDEKEEKEDKDEPKAPAGLEVEEEEEKPEPVAEKKPKKAKKVKREGVEPSGSAFDIDAEMPYGDLEPFGREDTAQELTEASIKESNAMVDQLERAEVAEEKRAVFRALTRLRGAAITSFDGVARSQTGNIDEYNKVNKWRAAHPIHHLANEESDVARWAFPDNADF